MILTLIILTVLLFVWFFIGGFYWCEVYDSAKNDILVGITGARQSSFYEKSYNRKQALFVTFVYGPSAWIWVAFQILGWFFSKVYNKILDKLK